MFSVLAILHLQHSMLCSMIIYDVIVIFVCSCTNKLKQVHFWDMKMIEGKKRHQIYSPVLPSFIIRKKVKSTTFHIRKLFMNHITLANLTLYCLRFSLRQAHKTLPYSRVSQPVVHPSGGDKIKNVMMVTRAIAVVITRHRVVVIQRRSNSSSSVSTMWQLTRSGVHICKYAKLAENTEIGREDGRHKVDFIGDDGREELKLSPCCRHNHCTWQFSAYFWCYWCHPLCFLTLLSCIWLQFV